jgi:hypothetical protein
MRQAMSIGLLCFGVAGCFEGTKPNPLPRAGVSAVAPKAIQENPGKTLYERLGREEGLAKTADDVIATLAGQPRTQALAGKIKKRALVDFLMEAASRPRPRLGDDLSLTTTDWGQLLPAIRSSVSARKVADADVEELLANIDNSR